MVTTAFIYLQVLLLTLTLHMGNGTQFYARDSGNPNPHLACVSKTNLKDDMPVVAHRTFLCGSEVLVCKQDASICTRAIVADRLGNHCKVFKKNKCVEYWSDLDLSRAVGKAIKHNGNERILFINFVYEKWQREQNLKMLKRWKSYRRLNS